MHGRVKFGLKIPNRLGECQRTSGGGVFDSHCRLLKCAYCTAREILQRLDDDHEP